MSERPKTESEQDEKTAQASGPEITASTAAEGSPETDSAPQEDSPPPAAPRKSRAGLYLGTTAVVLIAGLAGYATLPLWKGSRPQALQPYAESLLPAVGDSADLTALKAEVAEIGASLGTLGTTVAALDRRLSALEEAAAATTPTEDAPPPAQNGRLEALEAAVSRLQEAPAVEAVDLSPLQASLTALRERLAELEASRAPASAVLSLSERVSQVEDLARASSSRQDRALAFLLAVGQLREAVEAGP